MDSSQIGSDIADASRLQLVVTAIQRAARLLDERQKASYADVLVPFQEGEAEQYVYRVKGRDATQTALQTGGELLAQLLAELGDAEVGEAHVSHQAVKRLFADNFCLTAEGTVRVKGNDEIRAGALQSLDDLEATFRRKGGEAYKGYVVNLTETCDPRNELQLITHVQVAPNNSDDATLLCEALPELSRRTDLTDMYSDGGFGSPEADETLLAHGVTLHQTHLRGKVPDPTRYNLADFQIACDEAGQPTYLGCPGGQIVPVQSGRTTGFVARFTLTHCQTCPAFQKQCRVRRMSQRPVCQLEFTRQKLLWALRRQNHLRLRQTPGDPRAAIEATVRSVKHPFGGRLPVRGLRRVTDMLLGAAALANIRSIVRFHKRKQKQRPQPVEQGWQEAVKKDITRALGDALASFLSFLPLSSWVRQPIPVTCFSC